MKETSTTIARWLPSSRERPWYKINWNFHVLFYLCEQTSMRPCLEFCQLNTWADQVLPFLTLNIIHTHTHKIKDFNQIIFQVEMAGVPIVIYWKPRGGLRRCAQSKFLFTFCIWFKLCIFISRLSIHASSIQTGPGFLSFLSCSAMASEKRIGCWLLANSCRALLRWSFGGGTTGKNRGFHISPQPKVPLSSEAVARAQASVSEIGKLLLGPKKEEREFMFDSHEAQVCGDRMPLTGTR